MGSLPVAVRKDIIAIEVAGDLVVQDRHGRELARLDAFTARVWEACDGRTPVADIARTLETGTARVWAALDTLADAGLLAERAAPPASTPDVSRRRLLTSLGLGAGLAAAAAAPALAQTRPKPTEQLQKESRGKGPRSEPAPTAQARPKPTEQTQKESRSKAPRTELAQVRPKPTEQRQKESQSKGGRA